MEFIMENKLCGAIRVSSLSKPGDEAKIKRYAVSHGYEFCVLISKEVMNNFVKRTRHNYYGLFSNWFYFRLPWPLFWTINYF